MKDTKDIGYLQAAIEITSSLHKAKVTLPRSQNWSVIALRFETICVGSSIWTVRQQISVKIPCAGARKLIPWSWPLSRAAPEPSSLSCALRPALCPEWIQTFPSHVHFDFGTEQIVSPRQLSVHGGWGHTVMLLFARCLVCVVYSRSTVEAKGNVLEYKTNDSP